MDLDIIMSSGSAGWLSDNEITAALKLLKQQYPHVGAMQDVVLGKLRMKSMKSKLCMYRITL